MYGENIHVIKMIKKTDLKIIHKIIGIFCSAFSTFRGGINTRRL